MEPSSPNRTTNSPISGAAFKRLFGREHIRLAVTFMAALMLLAGLVLSYRHSVAATVSASQQRLVEDAQTLTGLIGASGQPEFGEIQRTASNMQDALDSIRGAAQGNWLSARILDFAPVDVDLEDSALQQAHLLSVQVARRAGFWSAFSPAVSQLMVYDADVDLRGILPEADGPELVRRMYLAKGGLLRAREHMATALVYADDEGEAADIDQRMLKLLTTVDGVIGATLDNRFSEAATARTKFITLITQLQRVVHAYNNAHQEPFIDLQEEADETARRLSEFRGR